MNTDNIYAQIIAQEYAPKTYFKVKALQKLDNRAKLPAKIISYCIGTILLLSFWANFFYSDTFF